MPDARFGRRFTLRSRGHLNFCSLNKSTDATSTVFKGSLAIPAPCQGRYLTNRLPSPSARATKATTNTAPAVMNFFLCITDPYLRDPRPASIHLWASIWNSIKSNPLIKMLRMATGRARLGSGSSSNPGASRTHAKGPNPLFLFLLFKGQTLSLPYNSLKFCRSTTAGLPGNLIPANQCLNQSNLEGCTRRD